MPYITNSNVRSIVGKIDTRSISLDGDIFDKLKFPYFNNFDRTILLATKKFFENIGDFLKIKYKKVEKKADTFSLVYEYDGYAPAYHKFNNCPRLLADYKNFIIPIQIKGEELVLKYRKWFKENEILLELDVQKFIDRLYTNFGAKISENELALFKKEFGNGGHLEVENTNLDTLIDDIYKLYKNAEQYIYENEKYTVVFYKYMQHTYKWDKSELLFIENTNYSNKEIRSILEIFEKTIKLRLKQKLECYYRVKYNPEIELKGELLDQLGFLPCQECYRTPGNLNDFISVKKFL